MVTQGKVTVLKTQSASEDDVAVSLEYLADWVEDIDMAKSLHGLGGVIPTIALLESEKVGLRWRAAELIGNLTHNNPSCQDLAMQCRVIERLIPLLGDEEDTAVRLKAVRACSCLVRGHDPLLTAFEKSVEAKRGIADCVMAKDARLQAKAMFALRTIIEDRESIAGTQ